MFRFRSFYDGSIYAFCQKVGREKRIPFEVSLQGSDPFYSESNLQRLEKIADDIRRGTAKLVEHDLLDEN